MLQDAQKQTSARLSWFGGGSAENADVRSMGINGFIPELKARGRDNDAQPVYPRNFLGLGDGDVQWMWGPDSLEIRENEEEANWHSRKRANP